MTNPSLQPPQLSSTVTTLFVTNQSNRMEKWFGSFDNPILGVQGWIAFVAPRDTIADEELTCDYAMIDDDPGEMECNCKSPVFRKLIRARDCMKKEV